MQSTLYVCMCHRQLTLTHCSFCDSTFIQKCSWWGLWMLGRSRAWSAHYWGPLAAVLELAWGTFDHPQTPTLLSHSSFKLPVQHGGNSTNLDSLPHQVHFEEPQHACEINLILCSFPEILFPTRTLSLTHHHDNNNISALFTRFHIQSKSNC